MADTEKLVITGKIAAIPAAGKSLKLEGVEGWFNAFKAEQLGGAVKGDFVKVTYVKKGAFQNISKVEKVAAPVEEVKKEEPKENPAPGKQKPPDGQKTDNDAYTARVQRGNALNAAGAAVSGNLPGLEPKDIAEATVIIAERLLTWLRAE